MILVGFTFSQVAVVTLWVTLILLVVVILYKKLLQRWSKGQIEKKDYLVLYSLDQNPASDEIPFYFTAEENKSYKLSLLDDKMNFLEVISEGESQKGGNIIRFDSNSITNGSYFYSLETNNQKISKKMQVFNG